MSKYVEDERFQKADAQFIYWTKAELRDEIKTIQKQISILNEKAAMVKSELYSRNLQLYELNYLTQVLREPSDKQDHESV